MSLGHRPGAVEPEPFERGAPGVAIGLAFIVFGVLPALIALDVIPIAEGDFGMPRWLVMLFVQPFTILGVGVVLYALGVSARVLHVFAHLTGLALMTTASIFSVSVLVSGGTGSGEPLGIGPIAVPLPAFLARPLNGALMGVVTLVTIALTLALWFGVIRNWLAPGGEDVT